jgi:acetyl-CoA C-acetyltransferase
VAGAEQIVIAGAAATKFGRRPELEIAELGVEAARAALADAGFELEDVDAIYVGTFVAQSLNRQGVLASLIANLLEVGPIPATTLEGACASGTIAMRHGMLAVRAESARVALCIGVEQMAGSDTAAVTGALGEAFRRDPDQEAGLTFPGFFGLVADAHGARYGTGREELSAVAVKNRAHGASNPRAMFSEAVDAERVETSRLIADPLRVFDCSPIADGAAAAVVCRESDAPRPRRAVKVLACEQASGPISAIDAGEDLTSFAATRAAAAAAYASADVGPADLDVVEVHDCFTIAEIVDCEDLELLPRGEAGAAILAGATSADSEGLVVNPSGGLLSRGHPVGATGLAQIHELVAQLRNEADNQVPGSSLALSHNLGGTGAAATVTVLAS